MTTGIRTRLENATTAESLFDSVCQLYASVFGVPPFNRSPEKLLAQRRSLQSLMADPTFGMATAWNGNVLTGFAYGYALGSDTRWWDGFLTPVSEEIMHEWDGRTFAIIDMAIEQSRQGCGTGRQLLQTLLTSRPEERASLSVVPDNAQAQGFYRHLGWQYIGRVKGAAHHAAPFFDKYILPRST
jgi:ribosomal protein S18 acetylase RimI-like enzyme